MIKIFKHSLLIFNFLHLFLYRSECFAHSRKKKNQKNYAFKSNKDTHYCIIVFFNTLIIFILAVNKRFDEVRKG